MISKTTESVIDGKKELFLMFKDVEENFVIKLANYMQQQESTVESITFMDCSLSKIGIQCLVQCNNLRALNMVNCGLFDEDIQDLEFKNIKHLGLRGNYISPELVGKLKTMGFESLDIGIQKQLTDDMEMAETDKGLDEDSHVLQFGKKTQDDPSSVELKRFIDYFSSLDEVKQINVIDSLAEGLKEKFSIQYHLIKKDPPGNKL